MDSFAHFILTRFNVPLQFDLPPGRQPKHMGIDEGWLGRRFDLFERVCLGSVQRQTEGGFQWLVFMDWATPLPFKERMAALTVRNEFLHPVYCSQFNEEFALEEIRRREEPGRIRITTRLDNDDAIHPRLVARVQELARRQVPAMDPARGFFVSFPIGCAERKGDFYLQRYRCNPFTSFVSGQACARTVLGCDHRYIADVAPVVLDYTRPMWCQVIHEENVANRLRGVYWPGGGRSAFASAVPDTARRAPAWQMAEVARSAWNYLRHR